MTRQRWAMGTLAKAKLSMMQTAKPPGVRTPTDNNSRLRGCGQARPITDTVVRLIIGAFILLSVACGGSEPYVPDGMPTQNADGSWTPEFSPVGDSTGSTVGVARNEELHGDADVYPMPVYSLDDHTQQIGWVGRNGYWALGEKEPKCDDCYDVTEEIGAGTKYVELITGDQTTITYEEERMSALAISIMTFTMFVIFISFVLVGIVVARKADEVALKVAGYVTAIVFAFMAVIVPFLLFFMVYSYASIVIYTESGDRITISGWSEDELLRR